MEEARGDRPAARGEGREAESDDGRAGFRGATVRDRGRHSEWPPAPAASSGRFPMGRERDGTAPPWDRSTPPPLARALLRDPCWHHARLASACRTAPQALRAAEQRVIDLADPAAEADAAAWWHEIQSRGGAGLTVRPRVPAVDGRLLPPALRCQGADALRLAHGPGSLPAITSTMSRRPLTVQCATGRCRWRRWTDSTPGSRSRGCTRASSRRSP